MTDAWCQLEEFLAEWFGFDVDSTGRQNFERVVRRRIQQAGLEGPENYCELLAESREELQLLVEELVVPETWFFRDVEPFVFVTRRVRELARGGSFVRILSAPCSTGEEPYSIAMALLEAGVPAEKFHIDAVDVSQYAIHNARRAEYGRASFRESWGDYQERYFTPVENGWRLNPSVAAKINFTVDNLLHPAFLASQQPYDVIFCRNLLIYLLGAARNQLLITLDRLLVPEGIVFCGHSEVMSFLMGGWDKEPHPRAFACRKRVDSPEIPVFVPKRPAFKRVPVVLPQLPEIPPEPVPPAEPEPILSEARGLADRGALTEALSLCERLLSRNPASAETHCLKGLIWQASDRLLEAEDCFRKALYLDPDHYEALVHMSLLCERKGESARGAVFRERAERQKDSHVGL